MRCDCPESQEWILFAWQAEAGESLVSANVQSPDSDRFAIAYEDCVPVSLILFFLAWKALVLHEEEFAPEKADSVRTALNGLPDISD